MNLDGKTILLCVTGGIAAYKSCELTSRLVKAGADVHIIMTSSAKEFVTPVTFQALSRNPVHEDTFTEIVPHQIAHIDLADRADLVLVVPATANIIGKLANGIADDMVSTTVLATKAPVWIAPAMNVNMYHHPAVQKNMITLREMGYYLIDSGIGNLACGWTGKGRVEEPEAIFSKVKTFFIPSVTDLEEKRILITAGPTREMLDPVRFFSNRSTGKMGFAIAKAAVASGMDVTLVSGPTSLTPPQGINWVQVSSAEEMFREVTERYAEMDIVVKSAAVADYRPAETFNHKIKKTGDELNIHMVKNPDIAEELGKRKKSQLLVGFAAETVNIEEHAQKKLEKKNFDMVVANDVSQSHSGFESDTNKVTFFFQKGEPKPLNLLSKDDVAIEILKEIRHLISERDS